MSASIEKPHPLESLGRGALITFIGQIVLIGATFGSRVLLVRAFGSGPEYGEIALGLATMAILSPFASLGVPYGITRQMAHTRDPHEKYALAVNAVKIVVPLSILAGFSLYLAAPFMGSYINEPGMTLVLEYVAPALTLTMLISLVGAIFQGEENMVPTMLFSMVVQPLLLLVFLVVGFRTGATLSSALLAYVLSYAAGAVGMGLYSFRARANLKDQPTLTQDAGAEHIARDLFLFSLPLTMLGVASVVTGNVDPLVLGFVTGSAALVGSYSALLTMARLLLLGVTALSYIALPVASRLHRSGDLSMLGDSYATMIKWILVFFVPVYALFVIFPAPSLLLVYGSVTTTSAYASAPLVLRILATGTVVACILGPSYSVLTGFGKVKLLLYDTVASAAVDVVGSLIFVPLWGIDGAALAFALATITLPLLAVLQTGADASVHPFRAEVMKPFVGFWVLVLLLIAVPATLLRWTPGALALVGLFFVFVALYLALIVLTQSLVPEDQHLLGIIEGYLGRPLLPLRRFIRRFAKNPALTRKGL